MPKILLVEDDPDTVSFIKLYLAREGYQLEVSEDGAAALRQFREIDPDLIILDLMLPQVGGMELCRRVREESRVPIIMLTALAEEDDRIAGLNLGADDYVTKPFNPRELVARVRAVLRRTTLGLLESAPPYLAYQSINVDLKRYKVTVGEQQVRLTPTELRLLVLLLREPDQVFTRTQIIDLVFGAEFGSFDRSVDAHISNLRRKLNDADDERRYIQTVYGIGYKLAYD